MATKRKSAAKKAASKGTARKSARKSAATDAARPAPAATAADRDASRADVAERRARLDAALGGNIAGSEPIGPAAEHEDHEGGETDSLAKRGVRAVIELPKTDDKDIVRAPSYRERNPHVPITAGLPAPRSVRALAAERDREEGGDVVKVVAERPGVYPSAPATRRRPGAVFEYRMSAGEEVLPSWMIAVDGKFDSRKPGEDIKGEPIPVTTFVTTTSVQPVPSGAAGNAGRSGRRAVAASRATARTRAGAPATAPTGARPARR